MDHKTSFKKLRGAGCEHKIFKLGIKEILKRYGIFRNK